MSVRQLLGAAVVASTAIAGRAVAQPVPAPDDAAVAIWAEPDPAAVIGRWRGPATWRACPAGAAKVVLDVGRDGSGYALDLAAVLDGLGPVSLVPGGARRLEAGKDDLTVRWTTGRANRATLEIRFASGCVGTLKLVRDGTGAAACDELVALEAIGAGCPAAAMPPIAPADRATIAGVSRAAASRARAARTCGRHVTPLRRELVKVGCVPAPVDPSAPGVRVPACEALLVTVSRLMRCDKVPVDIKQRLHTSMQRLARWSTVAPGDDEAELRARAAETCDSARTDLIETITLVGCVP